MHPLLRRLVLAAGLGAASALPGGASQIIVSTPPAMVVEANPTHPVLAGGIVATAHVPSERGEILAVIPPQATFQANQAATDVLAARLRAALPGLAVTAEPQSRTSGPGGMQIIDQVTAGGTVRVDVPGPLDDAALRDVVDRAREAISAMPPASPGAYGKIHDVAVGIAACADLDRSGEGDALAAIAALARGLGDDTPGGSGLGDRTTRPVSGRADPLCGRDAHARVSTLQRSLVPTSASAVEDRRYAFQRVLPQPLAATATPGAPYVPGTAVSYGPWADARLRVTAGGPVLTVAGYAPAHVTYAGTRYVWTGPNGRIRISDIRAAQLDVARKRLRALGIRNDAIVTQLDPVQGTLFVEVRMPDGPPRDDVVAAIAGDSASERHEVRFMRDRATCAPQAGDVRAAVADAMARARDVARALGTTADVAHPIALDLLSSSTGVCVTARTPPYDDRIARRVAGSLALPSDDGTVVLTATFPIGAPALGGGSVAPQLAAPVDGNVARYQLAPPPVDYPAATSSSEARVETALDATHAMVSARFDPDSRHGFRNVEDAAPAAFGARIGATPSTSATTLAAIATYANENRAMEEWRVTALFDARPGLLDTIVAANSDANRYGNVWTDVLAERQSCGDAPLALAVRAIRSAAAAAKNGAARRLVAIDLAGPFAVSGRCDLATAVYGGGEDVRHAALAVRLAAYARVSYR